MQFFLHKTDRVRIVLDEHEFECTPERFAELEPDYPGLPDGATTRYWTPGIQFFEGGITYDAHDCGQYCQKVSEYAEYPVIFARVTISKEEICGCDPNDSIAFTASLEDAEGNILPLDYSWFVRLTHEEEGDIDRVLLDFQLGQCSKTYRFLEGNPLGEWFLDESKFNLVTFGGQQYQVKLINPVRFTAYRELA